ncbi:MAG: aminotransferase class I/II-fold pyridoxal phosphate-dependent enzyme, partial [Planctomycetia bacterium]|nr:aminotransferase class I/II-fold pyridoxal phosphate-dependent enzyme [Planctomycetia bacterium]
RKMAQEINQPENRGYMDNGNARFKEAAAAFMQRTFGVKLDPVTQVNHSIGSKPALALLPACFIDPGDITLMTVPGYPVAGTHTRYYGGSVFRLPLTPQANFFPDFSALTPDVWQRTKLLILNYPNSPTGKTATREFYEQTIALAKQHEFVVVQDAAHALLSYDQPPFSFLSVPGAMEVGVEVYSLSKGYDMIGWRIGWVCGHERIVRAFADVKDNSDSGQFGAIQNAAAFALDDDEIPRRTRAKYKRRLEKLVATLRAAGFEAKMPGGTYFLYVPAPKGLADGTKFETAEAASQFLITQQSIVTVPWDDAGPFLRFSVTYEADDEAAEDALMSAAADRLAQCRLVFK